MFLKALHSTFVFKKMCPLHECFYLQTTYIHVLNTADLLHLFLHTTLHESLYIVLEGLQNLRYSSKFYVAFVTKICNCAQVASRIK